MKWLILALINLKLKASLSSKKADEVAKGLAVSVAQCDVTDLV